MKETNSLIRLYRDECTSPVIWNNILRAIGIPIEEALDYRSVLLSIKGYALNEIIKRSIK